MGHLLSKINFSLYCFCCHGRHLNLLYVPWHHQSPTGKHKTDFFDKMEILVSKNDIQETLEDGSLVENSMIDALETLSVLWFSVEYILRLVSSPDKLEFLRDKLNILDIAAVLPFYVPLFISWLDSNDHHDAVYETRYSLKMRLVEGTLVPQSIYQVLGIVCFTFFNALYLKGSYTFNKRVASDVHNLQRAVYGNNLFF